MLAINGYGFGAVAAPSFAQYFDQAVRSRRQGFGGFGAPSSDYNAFDNGQASPASFVGDPAGFGLGNVVFCNKDRANRPQCMMNKAGEGAKAPIREMQRAVDRIITLVNTGLRAQLSDDQLCAEVPRPDQEGTFRDCKPIGFLKNDPIATGGGGGIDGIVGDSTMKAAAMAITFAGALKQIPNRNVAIAFINFLSNGIFAEMSQEIADYLNDVANNFTRLVDEFKARGDQPIQTQLDPVTIEKLPFVQPGAISERKKFPTAIVGAAAAMIGLTTIAVVNAAKKQPHFLYGLPAGPALGRRKNKRGRKRR